MLKNQRFILICFLFEKPRILFLSQIIVSIVATYSIAWALPPIPEVPPFPSIQSNGKIYHVNKNIGRDFRGKGSSDNPWATIRKGISRLTAGDTLIIHPGVYDEDIEIGCSGTLDNWISIQGTEDIIGDSSQGVQIIGSGALVIIRFLGTAKNIYLKNVEVTIIPEKYTTRKPRGIWFSEGAEHVVLDNITIDGKNTMAAGINIGRADKAPGVKHCYFRNLDVHHAKGHGVVFRNPSEDFVFERCVFHHNGGDGIAGVSRQNTLYHDKDIYFINCQSNNNAGDGFDIGVKNGVNIFRNCISRNNGGVQGQGFKVWGSNVWLINCLAHGNNQGSVNLKPRWEAKVYILNCTLVSKPGAGGIVGDFINHRPDGVDMLANLDLYLYNNILLNDVVSVNFYGTNCRVKGSDNNYFFANHNAYAFNFRFKFKTYKIYRLSEIGVGGSWNLDTGFDLHSFSRNTMATGLSDPGFTDLPGGDYSLNAGSYAVNTGRDVGLSSDIIGIGRPQGSAPDIGAYEYQPLYEVPADMSSPARPELPIER